MSRKNIKRANPLVFDDEPLEAPLHGEHSDGPSLSSIFVDSDQLIEEADRKLNSDDISGAIEVMAELFESGLDVPIRACERFVSALRDLVPNIPRPIVSPLAASAEPGILWIFEYAQRTKDGGLVQDSGSFLYRLYESQAKYDRARAILRVMIKFAKADGNKQIEASLINNYGYEYLLEENFKQAEVEFKRAYKIFKRIEDHFDMANTQANLLICRFGARPEDQWGDLQADLKKTNLVLSKFGDWRARKTLMLLARYAESRGLVGSATGWARRAVVATGSQPSQHRLDDIAYLEDLESRKAREKFERNTKRMAMILIYRSARNLIEKYGTDASAYAETKSEEMLKKGVSDDENVWKDILLAVKDIQNKVKPK